MASLYEINISGEPEPLNSFKVESPYTIKSLDGVPGLVSSPESSEGGAGLMDVEVVDQEVVHPPH
eukprot:CAMPEP_0118664250 /NCGR_PEP_ID=MMETSP0785-20121206/17898_1 /TAXON_ID=91992 /ORGANISM="Bolidomonas pacifica, Strain CCMP 1866" /LENGTH=64 /DNA_ID=CAMNT_0006558115 /DNA_START=49 /DNA_END=240 /DNA_ORIENTATION=-